jgi:hypothetical protein
MGARCRAPRTARRRCKNFNQCGELDNAGTPKIKKLLNIFNEFVVFKVEHFKRVHFFVEKVENFIPVLAVAHGDTAFLNPDAADGFAVFERVVFMVNQVFDEFVFEDVFQRLDFLKIGDALFLIARLNINHDLRFGIVDEKFEREILDFGVV